MFKYIYNIKLFYIIYNKIYAFIKYNLSFINIIILLYILHTFIYLNTKMADLNQIYLYYIKYKYTNTAVKRKNFRIE